MDRMTLKSRFVAGLVILVISCVLFYNLGAAHLDSWDEARYADHALEAVKYGNWLFPHRFGSPDNTMYDKPPLGMWLTALSYKMFGVNEFAARFWSAAAAAGTILVVFLLGSRVRNTASGVLASTILLTTHGFIGFHGARSGDHDVILAFFMTLALFFVFLAREERKNGYVFWFFAAVTGAFMVKSIMAVMAVLVAMVYFAHQKNFRRVFFSRPAFLGILFSLLVAGTWLLSCHLKVPGFAEGLLGRFTGRVAGAVDSHSGPWYYYFPVLLGQLGKPWSFLCAVSAVYFLLTLRRKGHGEVLFAVWVALPLVLLSVAGTKLPWYTIPVMPGIALFTAVNVVNLYDSGRHGRKRVVRGLVLLIVSVAFIKSALSVSGIISRKRRLPVITSVKELSSELGEFSDVYIDYSSLPKKYRVSLPFYLSTYIRGRVRNARATEGFSPGKGDTVLIVEGAGFAESFSGVEMEEVYADGNIRLMRVR